MFGSNIQHAYGGAYNANLPVRPNRPGPPLPQRQAYLAQQQAHYPYNAQHHAHARQYAYQQQHAQTQLRRQPAQQQQPSASHPYEDRRTKQPTITHLLYVDTREKVCEDALKLGRAIPFIHVMDVSTMDSSRVPECVTYLPSIVDTQGQGACYQGSRCEQYIKQIITQSNKHNKSGQKFVDTSFIDYQAFKINPNKGMNEEHIQTSDAFGLGVYPTWPKLSSDPVKAKQQSDFYLQKLEAEMKRRNIKAEKPIDM